MSPTSHRLLSASSAHIWVPCAGAPVLISIVPETDKWKQESDEGDAAHWVCETTADACIDAGGFFACPSMMLGETAPNGVIVTKDMVEGAKMYLEEIDLVVDHVNWNALYIEKEVQSTLHAECGGTMDAGYYDATADTLHIIDYKFGHGDVDPFENKQLLIYADGLEAELREMGVDTMSTKVHFHIVQPRCFTSSGPVKEWVVKLVDLRPHFNRIATSAHAAMQPDAQTASGKHCRYCPARHECQSAREAALDGVTYQNTATPEVLSDQGLAYEMMALENADASIKYRLEAMRDEAQSRISAGYRIPHYSARHTQGKRKWAADVDGIKGLGELFEANLIKDEEPVTPAEAERRLKVTGMTLKEAKASIEDMVTTPSGALKITRDDGTEARRVFSK